MISIKTVQVQTCINCKHLVHIDGNCGFCNLDDSIPWKTDEELNAVKLRVIEVLAGEKQNSPDIKEWLEIRDPEDIKDSARFRSVLFPEVCKDYQKGNCYED